jgi:hypothetical protein
MRTRARATRVVWLRLMLRRPLLRLVMTGHLPVSKVDTWRLGLDARHIRCIFELYSILDHVEVFRAAVRIKEFSDAMITKKFVVEHLSIWYLK